MHEKRGSRNASDGTTEIRRFARIFFVPIGFCFVAGCGLVAGPINKIGERFAAKPEIAVAEMDGPPVDAAQLAGADWVLTPPDPRMATDPTILHRRHPTLEPLFALPPADRPNLVPALDLPEAPVRANAAIGLARWGDGRGLDVLVRTVDDVALKLTLREAAAESLGCVTKPSPVPAIRKLLDRWCRYEPSRAGDYSPELHAHLLRALSRHVDAADDVRFIEALRSPTVGPRQESLNAFARSTCVELPVAVVDLRGDPSPPIRAAAFALLLDRRHPQAIDFARNALQDYETDVRSATVAALGRYGGPDARVMLDRIMLHEGEVLRAEAVAAYERMGAWDAVQAAANDKASRVRRVTASCAANHPDRAGAALLRTLLADDNGEVRKAAVTSLEPWPLSVAGPVLLTALTEPTYETRKLAGAQLAARWSPAQAFSTDLPPDRRERVVADLEHQWTAEFGDIDRAALAAATKLTDERPTPAGESESATPYGSRRPLDAERLGRLQKMLDEAARGDGQAVSLDAFGPEVVDGLERLLFERGVVLPEFVYLQVLPSKGAEFAALEQLASTTLQERRGAADRLAEIARSSPLRPLAVARAVELGMKESDGLVWRGLFAALATDASERSAALAYAGLSHPSPEIRRLSCEHLGRMPQPVHTPVLLAALADPHVSVVIEAVRALGHPGMLREPGPIEPLLLAGDVHLRFSAAQALHANNLPQGAAALERLAHDRDPEVRRRAAAVMGTTSDAVFIPTLIGLLDDTLGVRQAVVESLVKLVGSDVSVRPGEPLPSLADRAAAWKAWYSRSK